MNKSRFIIVLEAVCYIVIAGGSVVGESLLSDRVLTPRVIGGIICLALVAMASNLKAFLSQSMSNHGKEAMPVKTLPNRPLATTETPKPKPKPKTKRP